MAYSQDVRLGMFTKDPRSSSSPTPSLAITADGMELSWPYPNSLPKEINMI